VCRDFPTLLNLAIDGTGVGDPIYEMISRRLQHRDVAVESVIFSQKSKHALAQGFYANLKNGSIRIPSHQSARKSKRWEKFYQQMLAAEKRWSGNYMYITHPDVSGAKDDYVQSLLLALHAADVCLNGGQVSVGDNLLYSKALGEEDDSRADILEDRQYKSNEVVGLQKFRSLAKQGRISFS
jgi:phage FluMu gp28-like protein